MFWGANKIACRLWGRGFQLDACADYHNVQPQDRQWRLPFFSRWVSPYASATDMLQQSWKGMLAWCNPPFAILPRVVALLVRQKACVALVVPRGDTDALWMRILRSYWSGVRHVWHADDSRDVFFLDFADCPPSSKFSPLPSAESFPPCTPHPVVFRQLTDIIH